MRPNCNLLPFIILSFCLFSFGVNYTVGKPLEEKDEKNKPVKKKGALLYNGIQLNTDFVSLKKAYLVVKDGSGEKVEPDNLVNTKKGVKLILLIHNRWSEAEGRVWLGASLKVTAENSNLLLNENDLFSRYAENGLSVEDAKTLALKVPFEKWETKQPVSLDVHFRGWDKKSDADINGPYTIHSKQQV